jgi:hypothetical protein
MFRTAIVGLAMAATMGAADAAQQFSCSGYMHDPSGAAPAQISGQLVISPTNKISLNLGQGDAKTSLISDNRIQLKFRTREFTGEFFHYTGDLFLIHKSGHFAQLACTPN